MVWFDGQVAHCVCNYSGFSLNSSFWNDALFSLNLTPYCLSVTDNLSLSVDLYSPSISLSHSPLHKKTAYVQFM